MQSVLRRPSRGGAAIAFATDMGPAMHRDQRELRPSLMRLWRRGAARLRLRAARRSRARRVFERFSR